MIWWFVFGVLVLAIVFVVAATLSRLAMRELGRDAELSQLFRDAKPRRRHR